MRTKLLNHLYYAVCFLAAAGAALPTDWGNPLQLFGLTQQHVADAKEFVVALVAIATWLKGHWNLIQQEPVVNVPERPSGEETK